MPTLGSRLRHAWNVFTDRDDETDPRTRYGYYAGGGLSMRRADRPTIRFSNERTIISAIYTRIGIDVASVNMYHVRTDDQNRYFEDIDSGLNNCLTVEANIDQAAQQFRQDLAMTLIEEGIAVVVPVDTTISPLQSGGYEIKTMRIGRVVSWAPQHVTISLYNENRGLREDITLPKAAVAIIENPLYSVMNEPNSTLQRLIRKLGLLDSVDEQAASGKLDLIIQLPYVVKTETKRQQAEQRRKDIEFQLKGSQYGIAYTEATEKITQLNRPAENNLMAQVEYLTNMLWSQLGLTAEVMNGTAAETVMLNYWARTIDPICEAIREELVRKFLTKTARSQLQTIMYFRDRFKLVPLGGEGGLADIADKLTRNEIATSNELRQVIGWKPAMDPKADKLINSNMPQGKTGVEIDAIDSTAEEIVEPPVLPAADPAATALLEDLSSTESELDEALGGG